MALIAISGFALGGCLLLRPDEIPNLHDFGVNAFGYSYMVDEPGFWVITGLMIVSLLATVALAIALLIWLSKTIYRRAREQDAPVV